MDKDSKKAKQRRRLGLLWKEFRTQKDRRGRKSHPRAKKLMRVMGVLMEIVPHLQDMPDGKRKLKEAYRLAALVAKPPQTGTHPAE